MLRLDPHVAIFHSAVDRIAVGAQQPLIELDDTPQVSRALEALRRGVLPVVLDQLLGAEAAAELAASLRPALVDASVPVPLVVHGSIPLAHVLHDATRAAGHDAGDALVIAVAPWRLPDTEAARLREAGAGLLPIVVGDTWVQVGPYAPRGGCRSCGNPGQPALVPAHLQATVSPIASAQTVVSTLEALQRLSAGRLQTGWGVRIRQRDGAVTALRRRPCQHVHARSGRALPGTAKAA